MPDLAELEARRLILERVYSVLRSRWEEDETYYRGTFQFTLPENAHKTIPATGRNAIDVPADHIITDKPLVSRRRDPKGKRDEKRDDDVEAWGGALLAENEELSETPPLVEADKLQMLRGGTYLMGPWFNRERFENGDDMWLWYDNEDPMNVLMPAGPNPREVFIVHELSVSEMQQWADANVRLRSFDAQGRKDDERITLVEWYGFDSVGQRICDYAAWEKDSGEWLAPPRPSGYPYLPAERIFSGYGTRASGAKMEDLFASILNTQVKTLLEDEGYALSVCGSAMGQAVWERWRGPTPEAADRVDMSYEPGSVSVIPPDVQRIEFEALPSAVLQHLANIQRALETALFSGVIAGQRPTGVDTASGLAILSGQARLKFGRPLRLLEAGVANIIRKVGLLQAYLAEEEDEPIEFTIRGRTITAQTWGGDYAVRVRLMATDPEEESTRTARGAMLWDKLSHKHVAENYWKIENWAEEEEQQIYERLINSEGFLAMMSQAVGVAQQGLAQEQAGMPPQQGEGIDEMARLQQMAALLRAARPGGQPQQRPMPGSVEAMDRGQRALAGGFRGR